MASSWLPDSILTPHHSPVASLLQDSDKDGHVSFDEFIHYVGKLGEGIGMPPEVWDWMGLVAGSASSIFKLSQLVPQMMQSSLAVDSYCCVWHPLRLKHHERMFLGMGGLKPLRRPAMRQVAAASCSKCGGSRFRLPAVLNRIHWGFLIWGIPKMDGLQWNILFKLWYVSRL